MKQWTCKDCVKQGTDACYFKEVLDGYKYCHDIVVDTDYAYAQGYADAIDEFVKALEKCVAMQWVDIHDIWEIQEKLKENK